MARFIVTPPSMSLIFLAQRRGAYGGSPNWSPLNVEIPPNEDVSPEQMERIEGKLGLLHLHGSENLFAIDGQHRVAGIKRALSMAPTDKSLLGDNVSAIFVAHDASSNAGKERTRRLFTTVNKKAKTVSNVALVALDEDNGFAIVTRRLIDSFFLFEDDRNHILYSGSGAISASEEMAITSVVGLSEIVKDLCENKKNFNQERPPEEILEAHLKLCSSFFSELLKQVPEYKEVFIDHKSKPGDFRTTEKNHLLFRPAGQRAFARACQLLVSRGINIKKSITILSKANLFLQDNDWHHILWDPVTKNMITNKPVIAEAQLLRLANQPLRNKNSEAKLDALLASRSPPIN